MKQFWYGAGIILLLLSGFCFSKNMSLNDFPEIKKFDAIINQSDNKIDFLQIKLNVDKLIDSSIDINKTRKNIDKIVIKIKSMTVKNASDEEKLNALKKYLYVKGDWNDNKPYHYSFSDPLGEKIENKLLSNYLESREGNCVSMPILFLILGNKIGLDATLSNAPNHLFIKYTDKKLGITYNLETTSGAGITRDEWYRKQMPMTDKSIESGIYLRKLSKKESEAVILDSLAEYFMNKNDYARSIAISEIIMKNNVNDISSILRVGSVFYKLMEINYLSKYKSIEQIPTEGREYFNYLAGQNGFWFKKADLLGWVMPKTENEKLYMDLVKRDSKSLMY